MTTEPLSGHEYFDGDLVSFAGDVESDDGTDADGDGQYDDELTGEDSQDCNDFNTDVYPGVPEICDGIDDNNCDGEIDDSDHDSDGGETWEDAELTYSPGPDRWTLWRFVWTPNGPGTHDFLIGARSVSGRQTSVQADPDVIPFTGGMVLRVTVI
jgi:hypothetical protein